MSDDTPYAEFLRGTTPHLRLVPLRPILGVRRWLVHSIRFDTMRPVVAYGSEVRARQRAQQVHALHAQARLAIASGDDLLPTRVAREAALIFRDHPDARERVRRDGRSNGW